MKPEVRGRRIDSTAGEASYVDPGSRIQREKKRAAMDGHVLDVHLLARDFQW